jgi:aspartate/methionine/tyrosine aminotransferase
MTTMHLVDKMARIGVESAFDVLVKARALEAQGKSIIHLEIGEPDFPTPRNVIEAGQRALAEGWTKYGPTQGLPELRQSIANYISRTRGIKVGPQNVCVVPGGKPVMYFTIIALLQEGDEAIFPDPGFPIFESMIRFQGAKPVPIPLRESRGFSLDVNELRDLITDRTKLIILNSPQNPTGGIIPADDIKQIADLLRDRDIMVLSDEIYSRITYDNPPGYKGTPTSIASMDGMLEKTIILDGFSKTYSMTGWRLGYGVMPEWLAEAVVKLMVNSNSCTASFTQRAGIEALEGPQDSVDTMVAEFKRRRDAIVKGLDSIPGFRCPVPAGAFYVFPNVEGTGMDSKTLADYLLYEGGVACLDGKCFGAQGDGYLRLSYASSFENILEAVERIRRVSSRWTPKA